MFFHNFKYTFKVLIKNKVLIFWTVMWPLILGTLFNLAFKDLSKNDELQTINLGIVENSSYKEDLLLKDSLENMSDKKSDSYLFDITYGDKEEIDKLLEDKEIDGYIIKNDDTKIVVKENGINQTIIKYVVDEIYEYKTLSENIIKDDIEKQINMGIYPDTNKIYKNILNELSENKNYLKESTNNNLDYSVIEFYTLIAMAALFGAMLTSYVISNYLANLSKKGARMEVSPTKRLSMVIGGLLSSYIIQIFSMFILLFYTSVILKVDYGSRFDLVILLSLIGAFAGSSLGLVIGALPLKNENTKVGLNIAIPMLGCFFAGMMGITMKYIIDKNIPIINIVNPANMITDGFYALYYYDTLNRFYFNIISLLVFSFILILISYFLMRRRNYDSI